MESFISEDNIDWSLLTKTEILVVINQLCKEISEGASLTRLCKIPGYPPYSAVCKWRNTNDEVLKLLEQASLDRGEYFHDQAVNAARSADDGSWSAAAMQARVYQWAASVANPDKYSEKKRIQAEMRYPITYVINTGITRTKAELVSQSSDSHLNLNDSNLEGSIPKT